ncbi:phytanoyl-CoA dioxygenase family protein [Paenibacillus sp. CF384]|uniref:phytanoyl-CoA dioxygenase family protein n=1 Tax=Paenibacillus sp. CF384 TaxID=1884382 RepID=UPI000896E561|nr:phytanoyl-CoA dioxygenase family protein [Paenibacillus sp. CF384]SDX82080.1 Ectoine hydroxylase-related dioxygenase, phytanoyl-CoA dioxygenase (PhyH) family [Paenibacillus sp. CF384]
MRLSAEELKSGKLSPETLELAIQLIKVNGYVLFEEVLPRAQVEELFNSYTAILDPYFEEHREEILNPKNGFNDGTNHVRLYLPFEEPFCDEVVIANPFVTEIVDRILGEDCVMTYFATNTSMPGGKKSQPVHSDTSSRYGDKYAANLPIANLIVNYPLVDVHENNGPMEIWPGGTHLHPDNWYAPNAFSKSKLAEHMHGIKMLMPAGSILIRDDRVWHRGTPNKSDKHRPNIALIYSENKQREATIQIPQEMYDQLSVKAQRLLRNEKIGFPVAEPKH